VSFVPSWLMTDLRSALRVVVVDTDLVVSFVPSWLMTDLCRVLRAVVVETNLRRVVRVVVVDHRPA
jgi:hypothetical protein